MSETIQMRTTQEQSGDYRVFATATVGGEQPVKGLALHNDILDAGGLTDTEYVEVELTEDGRVALNPDKATTATVRMANAPAVRHVYVSPDFLSEFGDFDFDGEDTDLDAVPSIGIESIDASSEEEYEADKEARSSADEAAEALFGEENDSDDEQEADDSEDEQVEVSDEELGIVE